MRSNPRCLDRLSRSARHDPTFSFGDLLRGKVRERPCAARWPWWAPRLDLQDVHPTPAGDEPMSGPSFSQRDLDGHARRPAQKRSAVGGPLGDRRARTGGAPCEPLTYVAAPRADRTDGALAYAPSPRWPSTRAGLGADVPDCGPHGRTVAAITASTSARAASGGAWRTQGPARGRGAPSHRELRETALEVVRRLGQAAESRTAPRASTSSGSAAFPMNWGSPPA